MGVSMFHGGVQPCTKKSLIETGSILAAIVDNSEKEVQEDSGEHQECYVTFKKMVEIELLAEMEDNAKKPQE